MAITLRDITNRMISAYRKADYAPAGVHNVEIDSWRGTKALLFTADVDGSKGGTYDVGVEFFQVNFSDEQKPGWIPVESEGGTIYAEVPTMSYNNCALKCSCPDFQYRFEKELYDVGSTIGNWRRYKKVVGSTRGPVNPKGIPGFCFAGDTLIPLADGVSSPIKDLVGMKEFFVYSYDGELGQVVIGRGHDCRKTRELTRTVRVALDNGQRISCTPDHLFLLKSGKYRMARDLIPGDSLMPMYRRLSQNKRVRDYEEVCSGEDNWLFTHSIQEFWGSPENFERTEKMREGMSTRAKLRVGPLNSFFGKKHSPETRAKMSLAKKGKTWAEIRGQVSNHKVIGIESGKFEDVYCFTVDSYENFAVDVDGGVKQSSGVFVHNCKHVYSLIQALVNSRMLKD